MVQAQGKYLAGMVRVPLAAIGERINLEKLVSGRYPLRDIHAAFAAAEGKNALKIVIQPDLAEAQGHTR